MGAECGPWPSCDFHQYRSWLRQSDPPPAATVAADKDKQKPKSRSRRRPPVGDYQVTFRHHGEPADYERDYLSQVTNVRCKAANPAASLLTQDSSDLCLDPSPRPTSPPPKPASSPPRPAAASCRAAPPSVGSTPDLSGDSESVLPRSGSSPDLCQLPPVLGASPRPADRPPPAAAAGAASAASDAGPSPRRAADQSAARARVARREPDQSGAGGGALRRRRQQARQASTPHTVTLDLLTPETYSCVSQARLAGPKPRALTKIQLASTVPEDLTIIVGRKLEISLSGGKRAPRGRGLR